MFWVPKQIVFATILCYCILLLYIHMQLDCYYFPYMNALLNLQLFQRYKTYDMICTISHTSSLDSKITASHAIFEISRGYILARGLFRSWRGIMIVHYVCCCLLLFVALFPLMISLNRWRYENLAKNKKVSSWWEDVHQKNEF